MPSVSEGFLSEWVVCLHVDRNACEEPARALRDWFARHRPAAGVDTVLVVDESLADVGEAAVAAASSEPDASPIRLLVIPDTAGRWESLRRLQQLFPHRDVAYARLGLEAPAGWGDLLRRAAAEDARIGVVSPLSDRTPVFSPFQTERPAWMNAAHVNRWLGTLSRAHVFETPEVLPFCSYLRHEALRQCLESQPGASDHKLVAVMRANGWSCVGCDWLFVGWTGNTDFDTAKGAAPDVDTQLYLSVHPLGRIRHAFGEADAWGAASVPAEVAPLRPVQLHITHCWGGGLGRWVQDMCEADSRRHNLVLRAIGTWGGFGHRVSLFASHEMGVPLREWHFDQPIKSVAISHVQYRKILDEIIRDFHVDALVVSSLIGHSLDALRTSLPTVVCAHDYFPFCPALVIRFRSVCESCDGRRLAECFAENPLNRFFRETGSDEWTGIRRNYLDAMRAEHIRLAAPSASVIEHLRSLAPELAQVPAAVVPNGIDLPEAEPFEPGERLTVVVLGSLAPHKGAELLMQALPHILEFADVHLVGCGEGGAPFERFAGVRRVPAYRRDELPRLIASIRPHAGLLLSVVPETFSYTLSELWAMGVPPIATNIGSFAERIEHERNGLLIEPVADELVAALRRIDAQREFLQTMRQVIRDTPRFTREDMVLGYHRVGALAPYCGLPGPGPAAMQDRSREQIGALYVDRQAPIRLVLADFIAFLIAKAQSTPRLGPAGRRALASVLTRLHRHVRA